MCHAHFKLSGLANVSFSIRLDCVVLNLFCYLTPNDPLQIQNTMKFNLVPAKV